MDMYGVSIRNHNGGVRCQYPSPQWMCTVLVPVTTMEVYGVRTRHHNGDVRCQYPSPQWRCTVSVLVTTMEMYGVSTRHHNGGVRCQYSSPQWRCTVSVPVTTMEVYGVSTRHHNGEGQLLSRGRNPHRGPYGSIHYCIAPLYAMVYHGALKQTNHGNIQSCFETMVNYCMPYIAINNI